MIEDAINSFPAAEAACYFASNRQTQPGATMDLEYSNRTKQLAERLTVFMNEHIYPNEARFDEEIARGDRWEPLALLEELKRKARGQGLWNLFLPAGHGSGLS